jgi:PTH1 family peptidyl-tRNA hydrolase
MFRYNLSIVYTIPYETHHWPWQPWRRVRTNTRHNVGSMFVRAFAGAHDVPMQARSKFNADIAELTIAGLKVLFVVPTTYYNSSGETVQALSAFYKIATEDILIIS